MSPSYQCFHYLLPSKVSANGWFIVCQSTTFYASKLFWTIQIFFPDFEFIFIMLWILLEYFFVSLINIVGRVDEHVSEIIKITSKPWAIVILHIHANIISPTCSSPKKQHVYLASNNITSIHFHGVNIVLSMNTCWILVIIMFIIAWSSLVARSMFPTIN